MNLAHALAHSIRTQGSLSLATWMAQANAHFYARQDPFGTNGHFITAPEISQMFGELIGLWCVDVWHAMDCPHPFTLAEAGPGRGTLMTDALRAARKAEPRFSPKVVFVETSPFLRAHLRTSHPTATCVNSMEDISCDNPFIVVANEFLDALPIHQFVRASTNWFERRVTLSPEGDFSLTTAQTSAPVDHLLPNDAPLGTIAELRPQAEAIAHMLAARMTHTPAAALFIDYGNSSPLGDTLQAVHHHGPAEVLGSPGAHDLSSHVDFSRFTHAARRGGAQVHGPCPQGSFLASLGLHQRAEQLNPTPTAEVHRLTHPNAMGTLFKAVALTSPHLPPPAGFAPPC